jgi:glycerol kinase
VKKTFILALDLGTTGVRAILYDERIRPVASAYQETTQHYPREGWVEQDACEIWTSLTAVVKRALKKAKVDAGSGQVAAMGITNQRETAILWDKATGQPVAPAIVWQCRRTAPLCQELRARGLEPEVRERTGLTIDAYFSATKIRWLLDHIPGLRRRAEKGEILFGTVDSWILWRLTGGKAHLTDYTNASRTMLFNIRTLEWDPFLLRELDIPSCLLPQVRPSASLYGMGQIGALQAPVTGMAGDQHAALFGQGCFWAGQAKNTYGTGCFLLMNTGSDCIRSRSGLISTIAAGQGRVQYALEGSVFVGGAAVQWLRDELGLIAAAAESEACALRAGNSGGVVVVPAFTGLGAPYWNMYARGTIFGLTRGSGRDQIVRATLESIAFQTMDVYQAMLRDLDGAGALQIVRELRADGGAADNAFLMQFQADILGIPLRVAPHKETTALGAAFLAALGAGILRDMAEIQALVQTGAKAGPLYSPRMGETESEGLRRQWRRAVGQAVSWAGADPELVQRGEDSAGGV